MFWKRDTAYFQRQRDLDLAEQTASRAFLHCSQLPDALMAFQDETLNNVLLTLDEKNRSAVL